MKLLPYILLILSAGLTVGAFLAHPMPDAGGDIAEYYGITESILNHGTIDLNKNDELTLSGVLHSEYFSNPGYYLQGSDGKRYPVHFIAYSLLLVPFRWILMVLNINPLKIFAVVNTLIFFTVAAYIMRFHIRSNWSRIVFVVILLSTPLVFFLWWPGPDIFSMMLLLLSLFVFADDKPILAASISAIASWQSQPLLIVALVQLIYAFCYRKTSIFRHVHFALVILGIGSIPYIYNYLVFHTWTPWTILQDYWTKTYGFGLQHVSLQKTYEQFFDLNMGVFWYAPLLTTLYFALCFKEIKHDAKILWLIAMLTVSLIAFQTNPAWNYGTSGFGPSRHAIVIIPFFITLLVTFSKKTKIWMLLTGLILLSQIYVLSVNNYIFPIFTNTLVHNPIAEFVLNHWPSLYNPTPEIFVDRTNHTDLDHPTSAIYEMNGVCKKAYVLPNDIDRVINTCGPFPKPESVEVLNPETDGFYVNYN